MSQLRSQYITFYEQPERPRPHGRNAQRVGARALMRSHEGAIPPLPVIVVSRLRISAIAVRQRPAPLEIKGSALMHKVVFAAALEVGLITAPMSQFVSSATAQQQASTEKNAKTKKEPRAGQLATRERQRKSGAESKEAKASN